MESLSADLSGGDASFSGLIGRDASFIDRRLKVLGLELQGGDGARSSLSFHPRGGRGSWIVVELVVTDGRECLADDKLEFESPRWNLIDLRSCSRREDVRFDLNSAYAR